MTDHAATTTSAVIFEDHGRRNTILALLAVAAGLSIIAVALRLDISPLGGLWPGSSSDRYALPTLILPDTDADDEVAAAPIRSEPVPRSRSAIALRGIEGADPSTPTVPPVVDPPPTIPEATDGLLVTILRGTTDTATSVLEPVVDVDGLLGWLLDPPADDTPLLAPLGLTLI